MALLAELADTIIHHRKDGETMTTKEKVLEAVKQLPSDASIEDAIDRLYLLYKVERGVSQADQGHVVTQAEAKERLKHWLR